VKRRLTLTKKILLLAVINALALAAVFAVVVAVRFGGSLSTLMTAAARDQVVDISNRFMRDLEGTPPDGLEALTARYRQESGYALYLFAVAGRKQLSGPPLELPAEVAKVIETLPVAKLATSLAGDQMRSILAAARGRAREPFFIRTNGAIPYWIGIVSQPQLQGDDRPVPCVLLFAFPSVLQSPLARPLLVSLGITGIAALVSVFCWVPLVRGLKVSVAEMKVATEKIADGDFDVEIGVQRGDEVGQLAHAIDRMASRLENSVKGQKRFFGDIAHELRTPLGRMRVALELAAQDADEHQTRHIARLQRELDLMADITDQFITLAKSEMRHGVLEPIRIGEIVDRVVQIENDGQTEIRVNVDSDLEALAHPEYLFRCLSNLLRNSVRYAAGAGPIDVSAERNDAGVSITVADCGPGVPEDALEKIFEPFYRTDESRDRRSGGIGLGLAIVRSCVEACSGAIDCRNRSPHGLAVTIRLQPPLQS
jgi:two-component system sensor histidine kinase CpxA